MTSTAPFSAKDLSGDSLFIIAGPCVIESEKMSLSIAQELRSLADLHGITIIFKASFAKANRTAAASFRGVGLEEGLKVLDRVRRTSGLPVLTDIHESHQAAAVAEIVDIIQIPALLARQTELLEAAGATGKWINIKKGQFMAPEDMRFAAEKAGTKVLLTERGTFFGYHRLVVDFMGLSILKETGRPVIFDATHSVQNPSGGNGCSSGNRDRAISLAMAALCQGINGLFFEIHPDPDNALCDGPNSLSVNEFRRQLPRLVELFHTMHQWRH